MDYEFTLALANWTLQITTLGMFIVSFFIFVPFYILYLSGNARVHLRRGRTSFNYLKTISDNIVLDTVVDSVNPSFGSTICRNIIILYGTVSIEFTCHCC